jgi:hypothetical protein
MQQVITVYLSGSISQDPETYKWREKFEWLTTSKAYLKVLNPCKNSYNGSIRQAQHKNGATFVKEAVAVTGGMLRPKDYQMLKTCNLCVVNLDLVTKDKPPIGTIHELAWCHDIFYIPVIAIVGKEKNIFSNHPFNTACCSAMVETVEQAVDMIDTIFN